MSRKGTPRCQRRTTCDAIRATCPEELRDAHLSAIKQYHSLLSPIKQLSIDVLSSIFLCCQPDNPLSSQPSPIDPTHPSIIISQVCQLWRTVALGTPQLWLVIKLGIPPYPLRDLGDGWEPHGGRAVLDQLNLRKGIWELRMKRLTESLKLWIARTSECTLSFFFKCKDDFIWVPPRISPPRA